MSRDGIGVMINRLFNEPVDITKFLNRTIHLAWMDKDNEELHKLRITFKDGGSIEIFDDGQS